MLCKRPIKKEKKRAKKRKKESACMLGKAFMPICAIRRKNTRVYRILFSAVENEKPIDYLSIHFAVRGLVGEGADITFMHMLSIWFKCCSWLRDDRVACAVCTRSDVCTIK